MISDKAMVIGVGVLAGATVAFIIAKGGIQQAARSVGQTVVEAASGAAAGAVEGAGSVVGIPLTDEQRGRAAAAAGDWWNASLYLPAPMFLKWVATGSVD
jgi:hypothetical protein